MPSDVDVYLLQTSATSRYAALEKSVCDTETAKDDTAQTNAKVCHPSYRLHTARVGKMLVTIAVCRVVGVSMAACIFDPVVCLSGLSGLSVRSDCAWRWPTATTFSWIASPAAQA